SHSSQGASAPLLSEDECDVRARGRHLRLRPIELVAPPAGQRRQEQLRRTKRRGPLSALSKLERKMRILAWPSRSHSNPYTSLVYGAFAADGHLVQDYLPWAGEIPQADVFHIHWPEALLWGRAARIPLATRWAASRALKAMDLVRHRGGIIAWTVHNIE